MIDAICAAVSSAAKIKVVAATDILRMGLRSDETGPPKYSLGAENERARTVLMRVLAQIAPDRGRISWLLFYSNEERSAEYVLNLMPVPNQSSSTIGQRTAPAPVKSH
jgi:hypothetical protein